MLLSVGRSVASFSCEPSFMPTAACNYYCALYAHDDGASAYAVTVLSHRDFQPLIPSNSIYLPFSVNFAFRFTYTYTTIWINKQQSTHNRSQQKLPKSGFSTLQPRDGVRLCVCYKFVWKCACVCVCVLGCICARRLLIPQQANRALCTRGITDCYTIFSIKIAGVLFSFSLHLALGFPFSTYGLVHLVCQKVCKVLPLSAFNRGFAGYILC